MRLATPEDFPRIEAICNEPELRAWAADGAPPFDANRIGAPNFAVVGEEGCFLAMAIEPSRYMIHTSILPAFRGHAAALASQEALKIAFCETDALELETLVPASIPHAHMFARQMGFRPRFVRERLWPWHGKLHSVAFLSMTVLDWALLGGCRAQGEAFHMRLDEVGELSHAHDPAHDMVVGAAVEMVRAGRPDKGVATYNYWARVAGYMPISVISRDPLRIDIRHCTVRVEGPDFHVEAPHA
jgi:hypothetical protein